MKNEIKMNTCVQCGEELLVVTAKKGKTELDLTLCRNIDCANYGVVAASMESMTKLTKEE